MKKAFTLTLITMVLVVSNGLITLDFNFFVTASPGTSKITDNSGDTTFYGVFVGCNRPNLYGAEESAKELHDLLDEANGGAYKGWKADNKELLLGTDANQTTIEAAITSFKGKAKPGDEFVYYHAAHGGNGHIVPGSNGILDTTPQADDEEQTDPQTGTPRSIGPGDNGQLDSTPQGDDQDWPPETVDADGDEPDRFDNYITTNDGHITDDELTQMLNGFPFSVTIVVVLDCCYSGTFVDGTNDLKSMTQKKDGNDVPVTGHLEVLMSSKTLGWESTYFWDDKNGDGKMDPDELIGPGTYAKVDDEYWFFPDSKPDEPYPVDDVTKLKRKMDFTLELLKKLAKDGETTKGDTNKDGITTAKELFDGASGELKRFYTLDSDNDGKYDEDSARQVVIDDELYYVREDDDGDGLINEDPSPEIQYLPTYYESGITFSFSYPSISKTVTNDTVTYLAITVSNFGNQTETFNVYAYCGETFIENQTVIELEPGSFIIVTFRWNTTAVPLGEHVVSFMTPPDCWYDAGNVFESPRGEIQPDGVINILDISTAALAFGSFTLQEDINCDGIVDMIDYAIIYWAFWTEPSHPRWNPDADLVENGVIDYDDIGKVEIVFGERSYGRWNQLADINNDRVVNILDISTIAMSFGYEYP